MEPIRKLISDKALILVLTGGMLVDQTDAPRIKDAVKIAYLKKMWDNKSRLFTGTTTDVTKKMREVAV